MKNNFFAIFTIIINDNGNRRLIENLFTKNTKKSQQNSNLVYNISGSEYEFSNIIEAVLDDQLISTITSFKIYFYYQSLGFKLFIMKSKNITTMKDSDFYFLKSEMKKISSIL